MLQHLLRLTPKRDPRRNLIRLRKQLEMAGMNAEKVGLLASLLSLPVDEAPLHLQLSPQRQKEKTFEALVDLLLCMAAQRPVLAIIEDLHWADPSTLELLGYLLERVGPARIGVVLSARPDFQPTWSKRDLIQKVVVERLPAAMTAALVRETPGGSMLPPEMVEQLVEKTDGVPLFVEELTRMMLSRSPSAAPIPVSLNELLLTRLDLLPPRLKALAQLCAVVGRSFPRELLASLTGSQEDALRRDLLDLREAGLLQPTEEVTGSGYQFRHALLQEAAYHSLLRKTRRRYHGRIAQALAAQFPALTEAQPELLAHHFTEAGQVEQAIGYWARAGELASRRSASVEAVSHLRQALTLLRGLPDAASRTQDELKLLLALGIPLMQVEGASASVEETYSRAWALMLELGDALPRLDLSYWGIFSYYFARAEFQQAHRLSEHLVRLGERQNHRELLALGLRMMAVGLFTFGELPAAAEHIERALACSEGLSVERHRAIAVKQWINPRAAALAYGSVVYSAMGELDKARAYDADAERLAEEIGHPNTTGFMLTYTAVACQLRREPRQAMDKARRCIALSREHQFLFWLGWCTLVHAWALSELGQARQGLELFQATMVRWRAAGLRAGMPIFQGMLAEILLKLERPQEALDAVREGLGWVDRTGESSFAVELDRIEGESLRALGQESEAVECFLRARRRARQQGARTYALHVETTLARLLREMPHDEEPQHPL
jgi:predicted ATPase